VGGTCNVVLVQAPLTLDFGYCHAAHPQNHPTVAVVARTEVVARVPDKVLQVRGRAPNALRPGTFLLGHACTYVTIGKVAERHARVVGAPTER
jgi:hypothetical protein